MIELLKLANEYGGALALIGSFAVLLISTKFATRGDLSDVAKKVEVLEDRVSKVEGEMQHLPDKEITHRLELSLVAMKGELSAMNEKLRPVSATMERMQDLLMERPGK
jgi:hypothetical protein